MNSSCAVDLLFLACNRLQFTRLSFAALLANTEWDDVNELFVCDDGSVDGTAAWLKKYLVQCPVRTRWMPTRFGTPVRAMSHFIELAAAPLVAKIDNDVMLPPGWLSQGIEVMGRHPELHFLGLEAMVPHDQLSETARTYQPAVFISGLGLYRRAAFNASRPQAIGKWLGFENWQAAQGSRLVCGWIAPALPVFLLDRLPLEPWRTLTAGYVRRGWQREWPKYDPSCTLWQWATQELNEGSPQNRAPRVTLSSSLRIAAALRVRNEAAWIHEVLASALVLCERVLVLDDHSTDGTPEICRSSGERVTVIESPFVGLDESRDKNLLLRKLIELKPDWVLWIDGDEVLERSGPEKLKAAAIGGSDVAAFSLRIAYLWDRADQVRVDGVYGQFRRPSFFRMDGQNVSRIRFPTTGHGGNFHCGNVPLGLSGTTSKLDVRLKHYGYLEAGKRRARYDFYTSTDRNNQSEDNYRHIIGLPGARFAGAAPQFIPWQE